jgi:hypothetical protein
LFGERHLRHILLSYMSYHNEIRTHLSLEKDAPISRAVELAGHILCRPILGGLHHQYAPGFDLRQAQEGVLIVDPRSDLRRGSSDSPRPSTKQQIFGSADRL